MPYGVGFSPHPYPNPYHTTNPTRERLTMLYNAENATITINTNTLHLTITRAAAAVTLALAALAIAAIVSVSHAIGYHDGSTDAAPNNEYAMACYVTGVCGSTVYLTDYETGNAWEMETDNPEYVNVNDYVVLNMSDEDTMKRSDDVILGIIE